VDPEALWREIGLVRRRGYAVGYSDHVAHSSAVAFPVFGVDERPLGAIAVGTPEGGKGWGRIRASIEVFRALMAELNDRTHLISASPILPGGA
jgi:DNA-binding IclR family transcriptional regulator